MAEPPRSGSLPELADVLDPDGRRRLATAFLRDAVRAGELAAGELVVVVRDGSDVGHDEAAAQSAVRSALEPIEPVDPEGVRIERAVGSTESARLGNTVTHLLEQEDASSAVVVWPGAPMLGRADLDEAAMKLRQHDVVLSPAGTVGIAVAGFTEPIDFTECLDAEPLLTLTDRALDAGQTVDFIGDQVRVTDPDSLAALRARVRTRMRAERLVPPHTTAALDALGVRITGEGTDVRPVADAVEE